MRVEDLRSGFTSLRRTILMLSLLAFQDAAVAANHYVWCGAAGTASGADFTNAYTDLPASLTRGDSYVIAGSNACTYGQHLFSDALSGVLVITVRHATSALDSAIAGWQAGFGTNSAKWTTASTNYMWRFSTDYYTINGEFGTVTTTAEPSAGNGAFGFWLQDGATLTNGFVFLDASSASQANITISNAEFDGMNANNGQNSGGITATGTTNPVGGSFSNLYLHDIAVDIFHLRAPQNFFVDHCWLARNSLGHTQGFWINSGAADSAQNVFITNSVFEDIYGTAFIDIENGSATNIRIYGNVFFLNSNAPINVSGTYYFPVGPIVSGGATPWNGFYFYNNTGYNLSPSAGIAVQAGTLSNFDIRNNFFYNADNLKLLPDQISSSYTHDYNTSANSFLQGSVTQNTHDSFSPMVPISTISNSDFTVTVTTSSNDGLVNGSLVAVLGTQASSTAGCGADTQLAYPAATVVGANSKTFSYRARNTIVNTCVNGGQIVLAAPNPFTAFSTKNFTLTSDTALPHLNDGENLTSVCGSWTPSCAVDPLGDSRPASGPWDRGAYQLLGSQIPAKPTGLTAIVQ
jgi:hypothetical protein